MKEVFDKILDHDEEVIKVYKPNKLKFYTTVFLPVIFTCLLIGVGIMIAILAEDGNTDQEKLIISIVVPIVIIIAILLTVIFTRLSYSKRFYAYTNKRILIQNGVIGIDYRGLDLEMIGATEVRVDFLDKLLRKDTGTLRFGSKASPMTSQGTAMFNFGDITMPYEVYREIKTHIDSVKK